MATGIQEQVFARIDWHRLVKLAMDMVDIWSPTGHEEEVARFVHERLKQIGLRARLQEIEPGRCNAVGTLEGTGGGAHLMFNGHLDTSYTGKEEYLPPTPAYQPKAYLEDGWIYGLGVRNMKSANACYLEALQAVMEAGVPLKGDVTIALVAGEIEKSPIDRYQGADYRGGSSGTWYLVTHGGRADLCVLGEPTTSRLVRGTMGDDWLRINVLGTLGHSTYSEVSVNAILKAAKIIEAIREWGEVYRETHRYGRAEGKVTIYAIEGGWPYRGSRNPVYCTLYVDARTLPGQDALEVKQALAGLLADLRAGDPELKADLELFVSRPGAEVPEESPVVKAVARAHRAVFGREVEVVTEAWTGCSNVLNRYGIPSVNYGPAGNLRGRSPDRMVWDPSVGEHVRIEDLYRAAQVYAALILDVCTRDREEVLVRNP